MDRAIGSNLWAPYIPACEVFFLKKKSWEYARYSSPPHPISAVELAWADKATTDENRWALESYFSRASVSDIDAHRDIEG